VDYGMDSILGVEFIKLLNETFSLELLATDLYEYNNIYELANFIATKIIEVPKNRAIDPLKIIVPPLQKKSINTVANTPQQSHKDSQVNQIDYQTPKKNQAHQKAYAIVAAAGHFSAAETAENLWQHIQQRATLNLSAEEGIASTYGKVKRRLATNSLSSLGLDPSILNDLSDQEQLIFEVLGVALDTYELPKTFLTAKPTGVFIGAQQTWATETSKTTNLAYLIPNKVSFHLNLEGPSEVINTYCTSAYVGIHRAIQSIQAGECEQAIVGGVNVISSKEMELTASTTFGDLLSQTGNTKSFCSDAGGFVRSEGAGIILLQPLEVAEQVGHKILGVIKASSVYHGGKGFSLEAPSAKSIKKVIARSLAQKASQDPNKKWHVGSIKPSIGHCELASGMASLIKVLKAFEHKTIPGIPGLDQVNTELPPNHSLILTGENSYWENGKHPRRSSTNRVADFEVPVQDLSSNSNSTLAIDQSSPILSTDRVEVVLNKKDIVVDPFRAKFLSLAKATFNIAINPNHSPIDYDFDSVKVIRFVRRVNEQPFNKK